MSISCPFPQNGGLGVLQIIGGLSQLMNGNSNAGRNSGGFDPSIIGNVIEMFTSNNNDDDQSNRREKRANSRNTQPDSGINVETILNIASAFMGNSINNNDQSNDNSNGGLINLLPMAIQAINSFTGPDGEKINARHKEHQSILPPFLERIHVMWDHFSNSELAQALWHQSGVDAIFKVHPVLHDFFENYIQV